MVTGIKIHDGHGHDVRLAILNGSGIKFLVHVGLKNAQVCPPPDHCPQTATCQRIRPRNTSWIWVPTMRSIMTEESNRTRSKQREGHYFLCEMVAWMYAESGSAKGRGKTRFHWLEAPWVLGRRRLKSNNLG